MGDHEAAEASPAVKKRRLQRTDTVKSEAAAEVTPDAGQTDAEETEKPLLQRLAPKGRGQLTKATARQIEEVLPQKCRPCPVQLVKKPGGKSGDSSELKTLQPSAKHQLRVGKAAQVSYAGQNHGLLNTGCFVSAGAWQGLRLHKGSGVLALGVHGREHCVTPVSSFTSGLGSIQLWSVSSTCSSKLCAVLVHTGASVRTLQWLARTACQGRVGLLLFALGNGSIGLLSVAEDFVCSADPATAASKTQGAKQLCFLLAPDWSPDTRLLSDTDNLEGWQSETMQCFCASGIPDANREAYLVAAGSTARRVFIWVMDDAEMRPSVQPAAILEGTSMGRSRVLAVAWTRSGLTDQVLACGFEDGLVQLWDYTRPLVPFFEYQMALHSPIMSIEWSFGGSTLCVKQLQEPSVVVLETKKQQRCRPSLPKAAACIGCVGTGVCATNSVAISCWNDGIVTTLPMRHRRDPSCPRNVARKGGGRCHAAWKVDIPEELAQYADLESGLRKEYGDDENSLLQGQSMEVARIASRKAHIEKLFHQKQTKEMLKLRPWEIEGVATASTGVTITLGGQETAYPVSVQAAAKGLQKAREQHGAAPLPLSMVCVWQPSPTNSVGLPPLLATASAAGIVHISSLSA